jgi:drug/metabolite transporter (DMT)-like permease
VTRSILTLGVMGAIWGLSFTLSRTVMSEGADPVAVTFWQATLGASLLLASGRRPPTDRAHLVFYAIAGTLGTALPSLLINSAARHLDAGLLAMCMAMVPLLCFALCAAFGVERFDRRRGLGVAVGLAAMWLIAGPSGGAPLLWIGAALGAAASYAVEEVYIAVRRPPASDAVTLLCGMQIAGALALAPALLASPEPWPLSWPAGVVEAAFAAGAVLNLVAYALFVATITREGPVFASQVAYVVTPMGVVWGMALLGERHPQGFWLALALMLAGLALGLPRRERAAA